MYTLTPSQSLDLLGALHAAEFALLQRVPARVDPDRRYPRFASSRVLPPIPHPGPLAARRIGSRAMADQVEPVPRSRSDRPAAGAIVARP